jgi:hypothetical protein
VSSIKAPKDLLADEPGQLTVVEPKADQAPLERPALALRGFVLSSSREVTHKRDQRTAVSGNVTPVSTSESIHSCFAISTSEAAAARPTNVG